MLDLDTLIANFGPEAIRRLASEASWDSKALAAMNTKGAAARHEILRGWLSSYAVCQGFDNSQRDVLAKAVLDWADRQPEDSKLESLDALVHAHSELMAACSDADGRNRDFTSLASKALWLRYPDEVPLYDRLAQVALWMLSKLEPDLPPVPRAPIGIHRYGPFALVWRTLFDRSADSIAAVDNQGYPYRVRIFDRILWLIGEPVYGKSVIGRT
jgi:hypothetical protein